MYNIYNLTQNSYYKQHAEQLATVHSAFEAVSILFRDCRMLSESMQDKCLLYYRAMPEKQRKEIDKKVDHLVDSVLDNYEETFGKMKAVAFTKFRGDSVELIVDTGFERIMVLIAPDAKTQVEVSA